GSTLVTGAGLSIAGALVLARTPVDVFSFWLGATTAAVRPQPTFDVVLRDIGHAFFPWSALALPAFARLAQARDDGSLARVGLRLTLLTTALTAGVAQTALAPALGLQSFAAPAALAGACALALDELDEPGGVGRWLGLAVAASLTLLLLDFKNFPEKGLVAFGVNDAVFPAAYAEDGFVAFALVALPLALSFVVLAGERRPEPRRGAFVRRSYFQWFRVLRRVWSGTLWFCVLALGSACLGLDALIVSSRAFSSSLFASMSQVARALVRAGWLTSLGIVFGPPLVKLVQDGIALLLASRVAQRFRSAPRGVVAALAFSAGGVGLSFGYYTALAAELSPKRAFDEYERLGASAPLGLLGVSAAVARYEAGVTGRSLVDADEAAAFLLADVSRRFIALRANELAGLNAVFRSKVTPRRNLPVLDSHAGEIVLASNRLDASRSSDNPFDRWVTSSPPAPAHPLDVDLGGRLTVLGWDVFDARGARVSALSPSVTYEFAIYYRVDQRVAANWDTFLHIDGFQRRFNGDHPTLGGHYPFALWLPGDFVVDRHEFHLGPEFSRGRYDVYFGLYSGSRRLEVRRGAHQDDRIIAGKLDVK
ncbi:MAG TPA: hypothetical protein VFQ35_03015, partial [Polyangiaceae bacterium]|nr:hypothetical protein [Polyangiaceae bacterium]